MEAWSGSRPDFVVDLAQLTRGSGPELCGEREMLACPQCLGIWDSSEGGKR